MNQDNKILEGTLQDHRTNLLVGNDVEIDEEIGL